MSVSSDSLGAFVLAAELGSFSAAARRLGKRQSTISETIANLEIDLGVSLFDRSARQPVLTAAGHQLLPAARQTLAAQDQFVQQAAWLADGQSGRLTLVLSDTFPSGDFDTALTAFAERFPALELECLVGEQEDVLTLVHSGRADLGLLSSLPHYSADFAWQRLPYPAQMALYVSPRHVLASRRQVDSADLLQHRELRLKTYVDQAPLSSGGTCWSAPSYLLLLEMAQRGFGWAELPDWLVARYGGDLQRLPVAGWPRLLQLDAVWSRHRLPGQAAAWLLHLLTQRAA